MWSDELKQICPINAYCKKASCENDMEIASMVSSIADKIGVGCFVDKNNINMVGF
jgi:hypothetical protein